MQEKLKMGVAGFVAIATVVLGSLGACSVQAGHDEEVGAQASALTLTCLTPLCDGPIEGEAVRESSCGDAGVPREGTLLLEAYPADLRSSGQRDESDESLSRYADPPTACMETLLAAYCAQDPLITATTFVGCDEQEHRLDVSLCPATVPNPQIHAAVLYESFAALLANSGCDGYADVFASSAFFPAQDGGLYVAYDPVGSGPHKDP